MEAIAFTIETLRKLECKFAVARFGDNGQLLKDLDDPFDAGVGEQILKCMSYDEGSYPFRGLERSVRDVWPAPVQPNSHRCVIMITDGIARDFFSGEAQAQAAGAGAGAGAGAVGQGMTFQGLARRHGFSLGIVQLKSGVTPDERRFDSALKVATNGKLEQVATNETDAVLDKIVSLIEKM